MGWEWDLASGRDYWFGDLETVFGIQSDTLYGQVEDFFNRLHPDDRQRISQAVAEAREPQALQGGISRGSPGWVRALDSSHGVVSLQQEGQTRTYAWHGRGHHRAQGSRSSASVK